MKPSRFDESGSPGTESGDRMTMRKAASLRSLVWIAVTIATIGVWRASAEKSTEPPLPEGVSVIRDQTYRVIDSRRLALDLYVADQPERSDRPAFIALHGGSWTGGSKRDYGPQFARLARNGFVVAVVDYRLARPGAPSWDKALEDASAAVDWLTAHASTYQIDPKRLYAIGTSAGGLLAAHLARDDLFQEGERKPANLIQAAVCLSTPTSLVALTKDRGLSHDPVRDLVGDFPEGFDQRASDASPITHVTPGWRPVLLIHGTDDQWAPVDQARKMHEKLDSMAVPNRLIEIIGARHGFELQVEAPNPRDLLPEILDFLNGVERIRPSSEVGFLGRSPNST
jgi:acetyl esterase/lipase